MFSLFKKRNLKSKRANRASLNVELLEGRRLLTTFAVSGTSLVVKGTAAADVITVDNNGGTFRITSNSGNFNTGIAIGSMQFLQILGYAGDDTLTVDPSIGTTITSYLYGGADNDTLSGGIGPDFLYGEAGGDILNGNNGVDRLFGGVGADSLNGGNGDDRLEYDSDDTAVIGGSGSDTAVAAPYAAGVNLTVLAAASLDIIYGSPGVDVIDASASSSRVVIHGLGDNDTVTGSGLDDSIYGGAGDDTINGGDGADRLFGEMGDDSIFGDGGNDAIDGGVGNDLLNGGIGIDLVSYFNASSGVVVSLDTGLATDGDGGNDVIVGMEDITGSSSHDTLTGNGLSNVLAGGAGNDTLIGLGGGDRLSGGLGIDTVDYTASPGPSGVTISLGGSPGIGSHAAGDVIVGVENATGSAFNDTINGTNGPNTINGGGGNDIIYGNGGVDSLFGNAGNDILNGGDGADVMDGGDDDDRIEADLSDLIANLTGGLGNDTLKLIDPANVGVNWIVTGRGFETVFGGGGNDTISNIGATVGITIIGGAGNDMLTGGNVVDFLFGGTGNDQLFGNGGADFLYGEDGNDILDGSDDGAIDTLRGGNHITGDVGVKNVIDILIDIELEI